MGRVVSGSCRVDKKSYDKRVVSCQPVYGTGQKIIHPNPTHLPTCQPVYNPRNPFNKQVLSDYACVNPFKSK